MADNEQNADSNVNSAQIINNESTEECKVVKNDIEENKTNVIPDLIVCSSNRVPLTPKENPFAASQNKESIGILKPPQLSVNNTNSSSKSIFTLQPSRLNPFAGTSSAENCSEKNNKQQNGETPKFVPLLQSEPKANVNQVAVSTAKCTSTSFVFGQNLQERVVNSEGKTDEAKPSTSINSNGTSEMLFSSAIKSEVKPESKEASHKEVKSLSESAREYEESRAVKRKYEEVEVITGEENETNILNIYCKLFAFDKARGSWQERGRGVLRLNDFDSDGYPQSRLVFRTTGIWRVILNTKIWADMTIEKASEKSVRFTALDPEGLIKVFLVMGSIEDSKQLYSQVQLRVLKEITSQKYKKLSTDEGEN